ncbi:MAG: glycosyltransferase family 4 protein [Ilumatobacteraceae bacterium]
MASFTAMGLLSARPTGGLRIGYLTGIYPRATDTFIQREVAALRDRGLTVDEYSVRRPEPAQLLTAAHHEVAARTTYLLPPTANTAAAVLLALRSPARFLRTAALAWRTHPAGVRGSAKQAAYFVEACVLARQLRARGTDHLHNHFPDSSGTVAMLAAELAGIGFSFTMHGAEILRDSAKWRLDEKVARARFGVSVSWYGRAQAMLVSPSASWAKLHVVHCGVDIDGYAARTHLADGRHVVFVGRLDEIKGLPVLLDAIATVQRHLPDVQLTLVGDGPDREALQRRADELGLAGAVHFPGYANSEQVRDHLAAADVFVLPSFFEGIPVSLMEAMASGVPVVASNLPGIAELVADGASGHLVPAGDSAALAARLVELLADHDLRTRMGAAGRATVAAEFSLEHEAARLHGLLVTALAGRPSAVRPEPEVASDGG